MMRCLECGDLGIYMHSVRASQRQLLAGASEPAFYTQCQFCKQGYRRVETSSILDPVGAAEWESLGVLLWLVPPWATPGIEADYEFSWDITQNTFFGLDEITSSMAPMLHLIRQCRVAGYGGKLRAGSSLTRFVLSRSKSHGLGNDENSLWVELCANEQVSIRGEGTLANETYERMSIKDTTPIFAIFDALAEIPIA